MKKIIYSLAAALGLHSLNMNAEDKRPNIIFIMADDLGWSDLGVTGSDYYETPNIDRLASQGVRFTNAYAAAANSAASALLSAAFANASAESTFACINSEASSTIPFKLSSASWAALSAASAAS